jgi:hypothetical protein
MDPVLVAARDWDGEPRFYPPGGHPATFRLRAHLAVLLRLGVGSIEQDRVVVFLQDQLACFEAIHTEEKMRYLAMVQR